MNEYTACEQAYKNGFNAGINAYAKSDYALGVRVQLAYEQLSKCHSSICTNFSTRPDAAELLAELTAAMDQLLELQVKLGILKREEA
jgi:hypothetical protein